MRLPKIILNVINRYKALGLEYTLRYMNIQFFFFFNYSKVQLIMTKNEIECIEKYLTPTDIMLEWGAGGSTLYFSKKVKRYVSVEDSRAWYRRVLKTLSKNNNLKSKTYMLNIISNEARSFPTRKQEFKDYIEIVHKLNAKWDKVLLDGRARVYCGIEVIPYLKDDSIVFLHDSQKVE